MNKRRLGLGLIVALIVLPPIWVRSTVEQHSAQILHLAPLAVPERGEAAPTELKVTGLWALTSSNLRFGGYSALLPMNGSHLRAFSDRGSMLTFAVPTSGAGQASQTEAVRFARVFPDPAIKTWLFDIESATRDPQTGDYWLGYEDVQAIRRFDIASRSQKTVQPSQMQSWPVNGGAEAMTRLADGRFLILPENKHPALLFAGDPVEVTEAGGEAISFSFKPPAGTYPVDLANLPDGRVLILTRALSWTLPMFSSRLLIADPRAIRAGEELKWAPLARLEDLLPRENYEGMAVEPAPDGGVIIWLISDDNMSIIQRTLLARLHYMPTPIPAPASAAGTKKRAEP